MTFDQNLNILHVIMTKRLNVFKREKILLTPKNKNKLEVKRFIYIVFLGKLQRKKKIGMDEKLFIDMMNNNFDH